MQHAVTTEKRVLKDLEDTLVSKLQKVPPPPEWTRREEKAKEPAVAPCAFVLSTV